MLLGVYFALRRISFVVHQRYTLSFSDVWSHASRDPYGILGNYIVDLIDELWGGEVTDLLHDLKFTLPELTSTLEALVHNRYPEFPLCVAQTD